LIAIYAIRTEGGSGHEHVSAVRWRDPDTYEEGESTSSEVIQWLRRDATANRAYVCGSSGSLTRVGIEDGRPPYLRAFGEHAWNDDLLALPRF
jgi:hypothetical protein